MAFQLRTTRNETENKTIRFPVEIINRINAVTKGKDITFSSFVIQACEYVLQELESANKDTND